MENKNSTHFGIYRVSFENGDYALVEAFGPRHAEVIGCELGGHRAAADCELIRARTTQERFAPQPVAEYHEASREGKCSTA